MAKKISQLTQATEVKSDDVTVIVQDGETKKLPLNMMVTKQDIENKKVAGLAKLDEIEATYENDTYTPTITVKNKSSVKTGEGDEVDYSANVMDGHVKSAILKGQTLVNLLDLSSIESSSGIIVNHDNKTVEYVLNQNQIVVKLKNLKANTKYAILYDVYTDTTSTNSPIRINDTGDNYNNNVYSKLNTKTFTTNDDVSNVNIIFYNISIQNIGFKCSFPIILEYQDGMENWDLPYFEGMQSVKMPGLTTSNEDGTKTNILSCNEEVTLRGIGDVKDTLDLTTGELTQRIGKMIVDGREEFKWGYGWNDYGTAYPLDNPTILDNYNFKKSKNLICEQVPILDNYHYSNKVGIYLDLIHLRGLVLVVPNELTGGPNNVDGLRTWLNENPLTVFYEFNTDSVKTVDLMPSGTHPSTTPYCWKNGHIQLSSSGLLPNLEYSVVTSRAGQINQNATMIVKNDKRIFDLEILLAGGLVNTTYQALTLQNQVETGLSKVSLSSETEPDYLLYHMIMKLIEEKAYKLDDLTEKVSVFYLYEKLSDEQFETIYSALYPFVEDEIVEEPVVEELPEVVEDEVIM